MSEPCYVHARRPNGSTRLRVERLEDRLTPSTPPVPADDPDDQVSEIGAASDMGTAAAGWSYTRTDAIMQGVGSTDHALNWSEYVAVNSGDVDLYRISVQAGDRVRFRADAPEVVDYWTDPATTNNPNPKPQEHRHLATLRLALYDDTLQFAPTDGGDPTITGTASGSTTYELVYTFDRAGTYYLGVSNTVNSQYDLSSGDNDNVPGNYRAFGPYTLTADYVERDVPDLVAESVAWAGNDLRLKYDIQQEEIPGRTRPTTWHHGVELRWIGTDGVDLGPIDSPTLQNREPATRFGGGPSYLSIDVPGSELTNRPPGATGIVMSLNAAGAVPELVNTNNMTVAAIPTAPTARILGPSEYVIGAKTYEHPTVTFTSGSFDPDDTVATRSGLSITSFEWTAMTPSNEVIATGSGSDFTFTIPYQQFIGDVGSIWVSLRVGDNDQPRQFADTNLTLSVQIARPVFVRQDRIPQSNPNIGNRLAFNYLYTSSTGDPTDLIGLQIREELHPEREFDATKLFTLHRLPMPWGQFAENEVSYNGVWTYDGVNRGPEWIELEAGLLDQGDGHGLNPTFDQDWFNQYGSPGTVYHFYIDQHYQYQMPWGTVNDSLWSPIPGQDPTFRITRTLSYGYTESTGREVWYEYAEKHGVTSERPIGERHRTPLPAAHSTRTVAVGAGPGGSPNVTLYPPATPTPVSIQAFDTTFTGGVRTAAADFNRDGVDDVVVGTGPGAATLVRVLDGSTQQELFALAPFESSFTGGVYVAAGDLDGDGYPDLIITPDEGGGPRVRVFSGNGFTAFADFFGIDDPNFRGGARAAAGDLNGDGVMDLLVAAGFGGGPRVAGFDGTSLASSAPVKLFADFLAFEPSLRNGAYVAAGDFDGDGLADPVFGGGPGGGPRVTVFSGRDLMSGTQTRLTDFFAGDPAGRGGVRVAVKNLDDDDQADLVVGPGGGSGSRVTSYAGTSVLKGGTPPGLTGLDPFPGTAGGVFVG